MITVVTFKWKPVEGYRTKFTVEHVNVLSRAVKQHCDMDHEFVCVTDDPLGLDADIRFVPLWDDYAEIPSPFGAHRPSCYRRLKIFSDGIEDILGKRIVSLDLDCIITGNLDKLWKRKEDFVIWGSTHRTTHYNGSMMLVTAGARSMLWTDFKPHESPNVARQAGFFGSDQGWISYCLGDSEATWSKDDGVYSFRNHIKLDNYRLPQDARIVFFHGKADPWGKEAQRLGWVRRNWNVYLNSDISI